LSNIQKQVTADAEFRNVESKILNALDDIVSFSGTPQFYVIGFVDMVNSSNITATLSFKKASLYYSTFLNSMSIIVKACGGIVVKNIGDSLMFCFQRDEGSSKNTSFNKILDCGMNMIYARDLINQRLMDYGLPELNYRISADYGCILVADSKTSFNRDLFGSPVNTSSRINPLAYPNTMVIGQKLYQHVKTRKGFEFNKTFSCILMANKRYEVYEVKKLNI
jgi:adenylate cyclase